MTNPPYGERISTPNLLATYKMIGERLKNEFKGNTAWVLSYREECFDQIGLKPSIKIPVFNGSLECELRKYQMFEGKFRDFRSEGNEIKTDEEKAAMAEKRRFKEHREFKKILDEDAEMAAGDIRSFTFKHHPSYEITQQRIERRKRLRQYDDKENGRDGRERRPRRDDSQREGQRREGRRDWDFRREDREKRRDGNDFKRKGDDFRRGRDDHKRGERPNRGGERQFKSDNKRDFKNKERRRYED